MIALLRCVAFLLLPCLVSTRQDEPTLRIGAFNIQMFGQDKMSKPDVVECIVKTLSRYDVVLIQEIRDSDTTTNNAINRLLNKLNSLKRGNWRMTLSKRLGTTQMQEQYAYFYKDATVSLVNTHQWPDNRRVFERPPYIARFRSASRSLEFGFIGVHTKPEMAVNEIGNLTDVYETMENEWKLADFIIGGDLNAGGSYVSKSRWNSIGFRTDPRFLWTTGDDVHTTTKTKNPYDRLVLAGGKLQRSFVQKSAGAFMYKGLPNCASQAEAISDHYPIELQLNNARGVLGQNLQQVSSASQRHHSTVLWIAFGLSGAVW